MRNFYKTLLVSLIFLTGSFTYGQITLNGCDVLFGNQDFIFNNVGTDATGRNIYQTTPLPPADIQSCPLGFCELQISWSTANNRWELVADDGADTIIFNGENLIQFNTSASLPNPPDLSLGTWTDATPAGGCGADGFDSLTGDVQSTITICIDPFVTYTAPADLCINSGVQTGLNGASPNAMNLIKWTLDGVVFSDGATISGSFGYNSATGEYIDWNVSVIEGSNSNFPSITYTTANSEARSDSNASVFHLFSNYRDVYLNFNVPLNGSGGNLALTNATEQRFGFGGRFSNGVNESVNGVAASTIGVFSGPGVTDDGNGMTYSFDPATAGVGIHTISYTYTNTSDCSNTASDTIEVEAVDDASFNYNAASYCINDTDPTPTITGSSSGMFSSTTGLSLNGSTGSIDISTSTPGLYSITYTTTGTCSNSSTASVTINALDNANFNYGSTSYCPSDTDPTPTITGLAGGTFTSTTGLNINTNTGVVDLSSSTQGTYTITYTTNGSCINTSNVSLSISDNVAPVADATALADVTAECEVTSLVAPTATDNCAATVTVTNDATLPINTQGITTVTWTYDDGNGNTSTQTQNIILDDVTAPVADGTTLADVTAECEVTTLNAPTATDNCAATVTATNDATLPISTQGTTVVTWTYDDGNGNTSTQTQNVIIDDVTAPVITCPSNITQVNDVGDCGAVVNYSMPMVSDNCTISETRDYITNGNFESGDLTGWTSMNSGAGSFVINDGTFVPASPAIALPPINGLFDIVSNPNGPGMSIVSQVINVPTNITQANISWSDRIQNFHTVFSDPDQEFRVLLLDATMSPIQVIYSTNVGDANMQLGPNNRDFDVTTLLQTLEGTQVYLSIQEQDTFFFMNISIDDVSFMITSDNDISVSQTAGLASGSIFPVGTTTNTFTTTDAAGNTSTCSFDVIVTDSEAPVADATALMDVTAECEVTSLTAPTATDNCAATVTVTNDANLPISTQGTTVVTWTYDDGNGNMSTQTQNVIIEDVTAPVVTCPSDVLITCSDSAVVNYALPVVTDNCSLQAREIGADFTSLGNLNGKAYYISNTPVSSVDAFAAAATNGYNLVTINNLEENDFLFNQVSSLGGEILFGFNDVNSEGTFVWQDGSASTYTNWNTFEPNNANEEDYTGFTTNGLWNDIQAQTLVRYLIEVESFSINQTAGLASGSTFPVGTTTNSFTITDRSGNTATCSFDVVIVADTTAPVADATTLIDITAECEVTSLTAPTATDDCATTVTVTNDATLPISGEGTTTIVTWTYDDGNGNTSTQTQNVIIDDVTAPVADATTLMDITAECEVTSLTAPTATDNCASTVTVTNDATLPISGEGTTTVVTWTYDDGNGNTSTQTQNVIIDDVTAPVADATTLMDVTAQCEVTSLTAPTATDNCAGIVTVTNNVTLPITAQGTTVITWTYDDGNGNTSTQTQNVIIDDVTLPVADAASLPDLIFNCEVTSLTAPTATDNCVGTITGTATFPITSTTVVSWQFDDGNGNVSSQDQLIIIEQRAIDAIANVTVCDSFTLATITGDFLTGSQMYYTQGDGNGIAFAEADTINFSDFANYPVTLYAYDTDMSGCSAQTSFQLTITKTPVVNPIMDVTACDEYVLPVLSVGSYYSFPGGNGSLLNAGTVIDATQAIFVYAEDVSGNCTDQETFTVTILPLDDASFNYNATVYCPNAIDPTPTVTGLTGGTFTSTAGLVIDATTGSVDLDNSMRGTYIITYTTNGNCPQSTMVSFTIEDNVAPTPDVTVLTDVVEECEVTTLVAPAATDDCSSIVTVTNDAIFPITGEGTTTVVTWTYNDGNGNTSTQIQNVIIDDVTAPVADVTILTDVIAECEVTSLVAPTAIDNCNGIVSVTNDAVFPIIGEGTTTVVTWTYDDGNGNTSTQTQNVIIDDVTAPVADVATLTDVIAECEVTSLVAPTATDNCANATVSVTNDAIFPIIGEGTTTVVTWTYDDGNCNTSTQTQNVIIDDVTAPVADVVMLADVTAECEVTSLIAPTATDNCANAIVTVSNDAVFPITGEGTTTVVTWTYDDGNGNTSTQTQNVIIDDVTAPVADVTVLTDVIAECEVTTLAAPTATDNCANTTVSVTNDAIFPITGEGTTTVVTWTYDDGNGNTSTQTQNVIIDDVTAPVADVAALPTLNFNCEVTALTAPTSTDNCAGSITATNTVIFPLTTSTLVNWSYDDGNGNVSSQDQLVVVELRAMDAISDVTVCDTYTLPNISGDFLTGSQMYYTQSGGNGIAFAEADVLNYLDFAVYPVTIYAYDVDAATGCSAETSFLLTINESPVISPIADVTICEEYVLPVLSVGDYYTFPGGNGSLINPGTVIDTTQTIFVYAEDASGTCTDETSFVVSITPSDVLGATFNDASFTYDGTTHSIAVENIPATATVVYTNNDQVDAGTYTVTATITSATSSCNPIVLTATMVINRAPQIITFDSLTRRRLNVDPDFQLMASSTSGLPVAYNFSFTGATAAAAVSNTGFVNLLAEGEILISASQDGNSNYLPASVVQQTLEVYLGANADLDAVTIDGTVTNNPASEIYYLIDCGSGTDSVEVNLLNSDGATFTPGATFSIATPRPGIYTQEVTVTADNGRNNRSYIITVERRFEFNEIVEQKYNNTLVVNNNFDNNGGYNFVSYEWFKNGTLVSTEQFFSEGDNASDLLDPTATYSVRMTTDTGEILQTCVSSVSLGNTFSLTVLENPVIQGRLLQVRADYPAAELDHAMHQIYSAHGQFIKAVSVQGIESQIRLSESLPVGLYRLVLITSQRTESVNFIKN